MSDEDAQNTNSQPGRARRAKRSAVPIRLGPPEVVPISEEDYRQAVTALATMIVEWWRAQEGRPPE
jgi:hypothetical protein